MKHLIQFNAQVIQCEVRKTAGDMDYWKLSLLVNGREIEAFHWVKKGECTVHYNIESMIRVAGKWSHQKRFQIVYSDKKSLMAANDEIFTKEEQLRLDFWTD